MVAANMDLPVGILRHARCLQQHLVERDVVALRQGLKAAAAEAIDGRSQVRFECTPGTIQSHRNLFDARARIDGVRRLGGGDG